MNVFLDLSEGFIDGRNDELDDGFLASLIPDAFGLDVCFIYG
jgi:hypothetical protein